jgi:uncharacterized protein YndB with AHSA1/START domain
MTGSTTPNGTKKDLTLSRIFDAPVEQVWRAWSESEQVQRWWGPTGFTAPLARMDFREGGASLVCMRSPDGHDLYNTWSYQKIEPLRQIEFVLHFSDAEGRKLDPAQIGLPADIPFGVRHLITFKALGERRTEMTVTEFGYGSDQTVAMSKSGLEQCLDKMEASFRI